MATIKSYTDISQSKKLAEILPLESADMGWNVFVDGTTRILPIDDWDLVKDGSGNVKFYHAWSLAALLGVLSEKSHSIDEDGVVSLSSYKNIEWDCRLINVADLEASTTSNPVDACVEMVIKLHELNLL